MTNIRYIHSPSLSVGRIASAIGATLVPDGTVATIEEGEHAHHARGCGHGGERARATSAGSHRAARAPPRGRYLAKRALRAREHTRRLHRHREGVARRAWARRGAPAPERTARCARGRAE